MYPVPCTARQGTLKKQSTVRTSHNPPPPPLFLSRLMPMRGPARMVLDNLFLDPPSNPPAPALIFDVRVRTYVRRTCLPPLQERNVSTTATRWMRRFVRCLFRRLSFSRRPQGRAGQRRRGSGCPSGRGACRIPGDVIIYPLYR